MKKSWRTLVVLGVIVASGLVGFLVRRSPAPESGPAAPESRGIKDGKRIVKLVSTPSERDTPEPAAAQKGGRPSAPQAMRPVVFHPRPSDEWQGMPVDVGVRVPCEPAAGCQLSLACRDGICGPCSTDSDCLAGERCVLDYCLQAEQTQCSSRRDCPPGELCILYRTGSDAFADPRGNKFLTSMCTNEGRGPTVSQQRAEVEVPAAVAGPAHVIPDSDVNDLSQRFQSENAK